MRVLLRKVVYIRDYEEVNAHTVFTPWYSKYQGYLPWYYPLVLSPTMNVLIPSKKTIGWSIILTCGIR